MSTLQLSQTSDLMTNYAATTAVTADNPISTVLDSSGNPIIFSIGSEGELWVTYKDYSSDQPAPQSGWLQSDLTSGLAEGLTVVAFDTTQKASGEFAISMAAAPLDGQTSSEVYVTTWLSDTMEDTDWSNFVADAQWHAQQANIPLDPTNLSAGTTVVNNALANRLLMSDGGLNESPLVIVVVDQNNIETHYFVNGDVNDSSWSWAVYQMPKDAQEILDIELGYMNAGGGVHGTYVLYRIDNVISLDFVSVVAPVGEDANPYIHELTAPEGAACLASLPDPSERFSNLYVAGSGVYYFDHQTQPQSVEMGGSAGTQIVAGSALNNVEQIILAQDSQAVSIWVLDSATQTLYYTHGPQGSTAESQWSVPLVLQNNVAHIAASRSPKYRSNQIVTALSNNTLGYQWQDPATTAWLTQDIPLYDTGGLQSFTSYTSTVHVVDEKGNSVLNTAVDLSSQQWCYVTVNGFQYEIGPDQSATVTTDVNGNLSVINKTQTISTPIYQVALDGASPLPVNPSGVAIQRMSEVQTGDDLKALFPDKNFSDSVADFGALTLSNLTKAIAALPTDGTQQTDNSGGANIQDQTWGGSFANGVLVPSSDGFSLVNAIETVAGDVIRMLEAAVDEIGQFVFNVVEGVIHFAVEVAGVIIQFTIKAIGDALSLLNWVLETLLGISLQDIIGWLGFIFSWDDIVTTHKVFSNIAQQTVNALRNSTDTLQKLVDTGFDDFLRLLDSAGSVSLLPPETSSTVTQIADQTEPDSDSGQSALNAALYGSAGNFAYYQTLHGGVMQGPTDDYDTGSSALQDFVNGPLSEMIDGITEEIESAVNQIIRDYNDGTLTVEQAIKLLSKAIVETLITLLKGVIDGLFLIWDDVISAIDSMLFGEIHIPLLTPLYELVAGGSSMSLVDGMCLLAAIPTTVFYKTAAHKAPFDGGTEGLDTATSMEEVLSILGVQLPEADVADLELAVSDTVSEIVKAYSQVGGAWAVISNFVNSFAMMAQALSEGEIKFASKITTTMTLLTLASSIPLDPDPIEEGLDLGVYGGKVVNSLLDAIMFLSPKAARFGEEEVNGAYTIVVSFYNLALQSFKFLYQLKEDNPEGDELGWDIETYVQDIVSAISNLSNGVAATAGDENIEVQLPAWAIAGGTQFISAVMGLTRAVHTIEQDIQFFND